MPFGLVVVGMCQHRVDGALSLAFSLTLPGGLEVERLETPSERWGIDDVHAIFAVVLPVQHDGHHEDGDGDDASSEARVQSHIVGAVHTWSTRRDTKEQQPVKCVLGRFLRQLDLFFFTGFLKSFIDCCINKDPETVRRRWKTLQWRQYCYYVDIQGQPKWTVTMSYTEYSMKMKKKRKMGSCKMEQTICLISLCYIMHHR